MKLSDTLFPDGKLPWMDGMIACKKIDEREWLSVIPLTFDRARICVCDPGNASIEHWCVDSPADGVIQWIAWPEIPTKWNRHQTRDLKHEYPAGAR